MVTKMHKLASSTLIDEDILVIDLSSSSPSPTSSTPGQKGTPLRPVFCLKNRDAIKKMEEREDCFILDFDPDHHHHADDATLNVSNNLGYVEDDASPDISIVGEKGQVACRDYPHSRHVCVKYPFGQTPHDSYCHLCYCFVCDVAAPCKNWTGASGHCHAIDNDAWRLERELLKKSRKTTAS